MRQIIPPQKAACPQTHFQPAPNLIQSPFSAAPKKDTQNELAHPTLGAYPNCLHIQRNPFRALCRNRLAHPIANYHPQNRNRKRSAGHHRKHQRNPCLLRPATAPPLLLRRIRTPPRVLSLNLKAACAVKQSSS